MTTTEVYKQLDIPLNLQQHMLVVAGLVDYLHQNWQGEVLDWQSVLEAALLHDIGNIVKFDLEKYPHLLGPELPRKDYWKQRQKEVIAIYGNDDHEATARMLNQLGVAEEVKAIIQAKSFGNSKQIASSNNTEAKVLLYCDLRVLPDKIGTLQERLDDVRVRLIKYAKRDDFEELVEACYKIEEWVADHFAGDLQQQLANIDSNVTNDELLKVNIRTK